jgi:hypothetical protein
MWMVEKEVRLADGSVQRVLVPQVYARVREGDLDGGGAQSAGKDTDIRVSGALVNSGTIGGRHTAPLNAANVQNIGGRIHSDVVSVAAKNNLNNIGGVLSANSGLIATAGRDINIETTTRGSTSSAVFCSSPASIAPQSTSSATFARRAVVAGGSAIAGDRRAGWHLLKSCWSSCNSFIEICICDA